MAKWLMKLPARVQRAALAVIFFFGGTNAACRFSPMVCDPAPPPSSTPMVCDPPPPPSPTAPPPSPTATPTLRPPVTSTPGPRLTGTPMICDPAPPPAATPAVTAQPGQRFEGRVLGILEGAEQRAPVIRGTIIDARARPLQGYAVVVEGQNYRARAITDENGAFFLETIGAGEYRVTVEGDETSTLALTLGAGEQAVVEWTETGGSSALLLPLAEVRTVTIAHLGQLVFSAQSPWPGAHCQWTVSGGALLEGYSGQVTWQPPAEPGRYLLQVIADWGRTGLAVDAVALRVQRN
ncbi:MAG: carboxypeptidase regulatory-like domain-containing protein, partial [Anaerolineales bacterium]|nr:carboxypeptidase regulatory-like domain-containing protein [Anaerolineales bacterium]